MWRKREIVCVRANAEQELMSDTATFGLFVDFRSAARRAKELSRDRKQTIFIQREGEAFLLTTSAPSCRDARFDSLPSFLRDEPLPFDDGFCTYCGGIGSGHIAPDQPCPRCGSHGLVCVSAPSFVTKSIPKTGRTNS